MADVEVGHNKVAGAAGLEPVTSAVTGQRSNQLSYAPASGDTESMKPMFPSQRGIGEFSVCEGIFLSGLAGAAGRG